MTSAYPLHLKDHLPAVDKVEICEGAQFLSLQRDWNSIVSATRAAPFYRHEFIRIWIDNFAHNAQLRIITGRDRYGRLAAVLPLMGESGRLCGMPVRQWTATANSHSARFDMIAYDGEAAAKAFLSRLAAERDWDVVIIKDVPEGGNAWHLLQAAEQAGFPVGAWRSQRSPYIPLPSTFDELLATLSRNFRRHLKREQRCLANLGTVTIERISGEEGLDKQLAEIFAIESNGWKGKQGTAIGQHWQTRGFYTALAHTAAQNNLLSLYLLKLDGRAIAFQYGLNNSKSNFTLKIGYDEAYRSVGPSHSLYVAVLEDCIKQHLSEYDFLGDIDGAHNGWKLHWTSHSRPHHWLYIFRNNLYGELLSKAKFHWLPQAKHLVRRITGGQHVTTTGSTGQR